MTSAKMIRIILLLFIFSISFNADAKRKKKKKQKAKTEKAVEKSKVGTIDSNVVHTPKTNTDLTPIKKQNEEIKPFAQLVVSFASMGAGIDAKARQAFLEHIAWFNTQNHCELMFDKKTWGREGEVDYCFYGNNEILMPNLYKQLKEKLAGANKVFIKQNFPCK